MICALVLSSVPAADAVALAARPSSAGSTIAPAETFEPARASPSAPDVSSLPSSTLCLLGSAPACPVRGASAAAEVAPAAGDPSSWTNITPPASDQSPAVRYEPAETFFPTAHEVVLFGGYGLLPGATFGSYLQDTWAFSGGVWTELIGPGECLPATCPSPRASAMLAYDPAEGGLVLFGGYVTDPVPVAFNDTWLLTCSAPLSCSWSNITAEVGAAPVARDAGAMSYDPSDNYVVLFGGLTAAYNALGDTWTLTTTWTNITSNEGGATGFKTLKAPEPRGLAAIADSPNGYVLLFGGVDSQDDGADYALVENWCDNGSYASLGNSTVAWWFYHGLWKPMNGWGDTDTGPCAPPPPKRPAAGASDAVTPSASSLVPSPPCGREGAALGWSPMNNQFVLYGGFGSSDQSSGNNCTSDLTLLNDTWEYDNASGGGFLWRNAGDSGDPPARFDMGYASDFTDDYFEVFGGGGAVYYNSTYRFFLTVHAELTGPLEFYTGESLHLVKTPFVVVGYGGSGDLTYRLSAKGLKNGDSLATGGACDEFYAGTSALPANGTVVFYCAPSNASYNIYRLSLTVTDTLDPSDVASASWIYQVLPPESMAVRSGYGPYFYENVSVTNVFTIYAEVANGPASRLTVTLGGRSYTPHQEAASPDNWTVSVAMGSVPQGAVLHAEGFWGNWTDNTTYDVRMITFPSWLSKVWELTGSNETFTTNGSGPFNRTYTINETYDWSLGSGSGFQLPSVDSLLGAAMDLLPNMTVVFSLNSLGDLSVHASLPLTAPSINMGDVGLSLSVVLSLVGTFAIAGSTVEWVNATAAIEVDASLSASIPIWGFCILSVCIGITLEVTINASAALQIILAPSTGASNNIMGLGIMIQNFLGSFSLAISAEAEFSVVIASVGLGAGVGVALAFATNPDFSITHWWLNGSIFASASFLFWSKTWYIVQGPIAQGDPPGGDAVAAASRPAYDNGSAVPWTLSDRYYNVTGYDANVWSPAATSGPAIADIYPSTELSAAAAANGAYLFFTNDNVGRPVQDGLEVSGERLDPTTNALTPVPGPNDPGYVDFLPHVTTLPNGSLYVLWDALPVAETSVSDPLDLTSVDLQGALFSPVTGTWGPVRTYSSTGFAGAAQVDATATAGDVVELVTSSPLLSNSTTERLLDYDLASGRLLSNVSVAGVTGILSARAAAGLAVLTTTSQGYVLVNLTTGATVAIGYNPPSGYTLNSSAFVVNSPTDLVLLYTGPTASELVLYDTATGTTVGSLAVGTNATEAEALESGDTDYVFVRTVDGIEGWSETGGAFTGPSWIDRPDVESYGVVQDGDSDTLLVYALSTDGVHENATVALSFAELAAVLLPVVGPGPATTAPAAGNPTLGYEVDLGLAAGAVAVLLAVVYLISRRGGRPPPLKPYAPPTEPAGPAPPPPATPPSQG